MKKLKNFLGVIFLLFAVISTMTMAQDTQLYIGDLQNTAVKHNVLFIFDTSGSMRGDVPGTGVILTDAAGMPINDAAGIPMRGPDKTRIGILKEVMDNTISGLDNLNVGYMRMNGARGAANTSPRTAALTCDPAVVSTFVTQLTGANPVEAIELRDGNAALLAANAQNQGIVTNRSEPNSNNYCYIPVGGNVLFPVADLDALVTDLPGVISNSVSVSISRSSGDAEQTRQAGVLSTGLDSNQLNIGNYCSNTMVTTVSTNSNSDDGSERFNSNADGSNVFDPNNSAGFVSAHLSFGAAIGRAVPPTTQLHAFRFRNTGIPANAKISSADISFAFLNNFNPDEIEVPIQVATLGDDTPFVTGTTPVFSLYELTDSIVFWEVPVPRSFTQATTPDLSEIVQEWVDYPGRLVSDPITFVIGPDREEGETGRSVYSNELANNTSVDSVVPPTLNISYCEQAEIPVDVGLNFEDIAIPQGVTIESAFIGFVPSLASDDDDVDDSAFVTITAHAVDDSPTFAGNTNISTLLPKTAAVRWTKGEMGNWERGTTEFTESLAPIVQEIVNRANWCGGNSMSFIVSANPSTAGNLFRRVSSFDDDIGLAPVLNITYSYDNAVTNSTGCRAREVQLPLAQANHSALQTDGTGEVSNAGESFLSTESDAFMGMIFELPISASGSGENITITNAELEFHTASSSTAISGGSDINIYIEDNLDPVVFATGVGRLDAVNRPRSVATTVLPGSILMTSSTNTNLPITVDVTTLVSTATERLGWQANNKIAFLLEVDGTSTNSHTVLNFGTGIATNEHPKLRVEYRETGAPVDTVRDALLAIHDSFQTPRLLSWTPSVETLLEAALYWRGKEVVFGRTRGAAKLGTQRVVINTRSGGRAINKATNVDFTLDAENTNTSHPASWTGGQYIESPDSVSPVSCQFRHTADCARDSIDGPAVYISPLDSAVASCAQNFQIFLTDGKPTWNNFGTEAMIIAEFPSITSCSVDPDVNARGERGKCAVEMFEAMANEDMSIDSPGVQVITSHTIAFNLSDPLSVSWLRKLAIAGRGNFYSAADADSLTGVFNTILAEILQEPRAFSSPAISANAFNRLFSRDETYFGLFEAQSSPRWDGNLKKYNICTSTAPDADGNSCVLGDIIDANSMPAVIDGVFSPTSTSVWSSGNDGGELRTGGAGAQLDAPSDRTIYTELNAALDPPTTTESLNSTGRILRASTWENNIADLSHIHSQVCPGLLAADLTNLNALQAGTDSCEDRVLWMLGTDIRDEDGDNDTTDLRWWFSDILHSSPVVVTYGMDDQNTPSDSTDDRFIDKILVGTNGGGIHMINGENGDEDWVFIPHELLGNQPTLYDNVGLNNIYGMDLTPVIRIIDTDSNGIIDPSTDSVHAYFGMRRGGNSYYALDLTPPSVLDTNTNTALVTPSLLWHITSGITANGGDFSRLGQTWSEPVIATIRCREDPECEGERKTVLIFGGGYDTGLDAGFGLAAGRPNQGNAIYIVDIDTGKILVSISNAEAPAAGGFAAIPASGADIEVPDMLYSIVAAPAVLDSNSDGLIDRIYVGDLAGQVWRVDLASNIDIGGSSPEGDTVVGKLANISDPATEADQRRFHYAPAVIQVLDTEYSTVSGGEYDYIVIASGDRANPLNTITQDRLYAFRDYQITPMSGDSNNLATGYPFNSTSGAIKEANLIDVTSRVFDAGDMDLTAIQNSQGWFLGFTTDGQKGLSTPIVISGNVLFTSYVPSADSSLAVASCSASEGTGVAHNLNLLTTAATQDWDGDDSTPLHPLDSRSSALGGGIPSVVIPIFTKEGVTLSVGTGQGPTNLGTITGVPRTRSYWTEDAPTF